MVVGSSPLARGLRRAHRRVGGRGGIIPARAGFTAFRFVAFRVCVDHPRSRGVYHPSAGRRVPPGGSSPLARGLQDRAPSWRQPARIIPARAGFTPETAAFWRLSTDHPRSRGVYTATSPCGTSPGGSSPLARGLRGRRRDPDRPGRIIPARAGFTNRRLQGVRAPADHPRSRGVYKTLWTEVGNAVGSSPLARGLPGSRRGRRCGSGIIPARAGFTDGRLPDRGLPADHPRSRGVYARWSRCRAGAHGSSPLARGLLIIIDENGDLHGIIPARAGFTDGAIRRALLPQDHPRSRGVYPRRADTTTGITGSSPLARGLRGPLDEERVAVRIIPARAGFTPAGHYLLVRTRDHPRSRGVYTKFMLYLTVESGSSPLARGLLHTAIYVILTSWIIPARAGFTAPTTSPGSSGADHPRSRGVYPPPARSSATPTGSSPLARGLLTPRPATRPTGRIIPARAGFTTPDPRHRPRPRDHPRSRGVYTWRNWMRKAAEGSSPLARGLPRRSGSAGGGSWIIPARAGFTAHVDSPPCGRGDHPRSRGVYSVSQVQGLENLRIIPARAGFTS